MAGAAQGIQRRYEDLWPVLNEQGLRRFAATEARAYGYGGVSVVSQITGIARSTIGRGMKEINALGASVMWPAPLSAASTW